MDFIKRHWSTLILITAIAAYIGISMGSNQCPMCIASNWILGNEEETGRSGNSASIIGETEAPTWQVATLEGEELSSINAVGKVCVLVYWASWCAPCREEIPSLIALRKEFPNGDLVIIGISLDENSKSIDSFVESYGINYSIARNNDSLDEAFGHVRYIPTMVVLGKEGKVQQRYTGLVGHEVIRNQIETLLAENV